MSTTIEKPVVIGAVLYEPKVSIIWDIIREFFEEQGFPINVIYYTNYEMQVDALVEGSIDMAWNSPLAWIDSQRRLNNNCRALAMRDTDRDRVSYFVVPDNSDIETIEDLSGKSIAVGAKDSPQATLIPFGHLSDHGLEPYEDVDVTRFDVLVGKHGDHIGGELDAFEALEDGEVDASVMLDLNWDTWTEDGTIDPDRYRILDKTPVFDHCNFTVRDDFPRDLEKEWSDVLFCMDYSNPDHREMMDMEGLKEWKKGRTTGYQPLQQAVEEFNFFEREYSS